MKVRIYKLAKDLGVEGKAVLEALDARGRRVRTTFHSVDTAEVDGIRMSLLELGFLQEVQEELPPVETTTAENEPSSAEATTAEEAAPAEVKDASVADAAAAAAAAADADAEAEAEVGAEAEAPAQPQTPEVPVSTTGGPVVLPPQAPERLGRIVEKAKDRPAAERPQRSPGKTEPAGSPSLQQSPAPSRGRASGGTTVAATGAPDRSGVRRPTLTRERRASLADRADQRGSAWRSARRRPMRSRRSVPQPIVRPDKITVTLPISLKELSSQMAVRVPELQTKMLGMGVSASINATLSEEVIQLLGLEFSIEITTEKERTSERALGEIVESQRDGALGDSMRRPPIVTVLGHVDHGKTSLLDKIRDANVVAKEAGGITQHVGAYQVNVGDGRLTFIDTPGHQAFTKMRARGANATDLVVLVVAADDGVMPQTEESINHARAAGVPIVVAINKIDKQNASPDKVKSELAALEVSPPEWGGDTEMVEVSAITGQGIDKLLETIQLVAELGDLRAVVDKPAQGVVLEARMDAGRGVVTHVLVQNGTLRKGDPVLAGPGHGRVRALYDHQRQAVEEAGPSVPVEVLGLSQVPEAGDPFNVVHDQDQLRRIADDRLRRLREVELAARTNVTLENLFSHIEAQSVREVKVVLKVDVKGSLEVLRKAMTDLSTAEVRVRLLHSAVGGISESDVDLAAASEGLIIGFNVVPEDRARIAADVRGVEIRQYQVIYQLIDDVHAALEGQLEPEIKEVSLGQLVVRKTFKVSSLGTIAGSFVERGRIERAARVRLIRDSVIIYEGELSSLRRFKDDVKDVKEGFECGVKIKDYDDVKEGDKIEAFEVQKIARTLEKSSSGA